ncbi:hypothetical protein FOZ62_016466 [Perkinsus olseni]|uniref:Poly(A) RNA polymerase mitochondrial-like central palm domain-containing protein n=2 Tax=Perkinsus olseni TaxID=32597 RepID=A0A7J6S5I5_PEROL|nr:hypothetical protein FOZ62_016466 [Perkinsus olseni]
MSSPSNLLHLENILIDLYPCNRPANWSQIMNTPALEDLRILIKSQFNLDVRPRVFGSASTGLVGENSDVDVNLASDGVAPGQLVAWLATRCNFLDRFFVESWTPQARVPVVKLRDGHTGKILDVSVANYLPEVNSRLIAGYVAISPKVRRFIIAIISWAKDRGLCGVQQVGGLSSYAITLMSIFALQATGYLPCLQEGFNQTDSFECGQGREEYLRFNKESILGDLGFLDPCDVDPFSEADSPSSLTSTVPTTAAGEKSSLCASENLYEVNEIISEEYLPYRHAFEKVKVVDLVRIFFIFYQEYIFGAKHTVVVSVRQGCLMTRHSSRFEYLLPSDVARRKLIIEDPFLLDVDLTRVLQPEAYERIKMEICRGFDSFSTDCLDEFIASLSPLGIEPVRVHDAGLEDSAAGSPKTAALPRLQLPLPVRRPSPSPLGIGEVGGSIPTTGSLMPRNIYHIRRAP